MSLNEVRLGKYSVKYISYQVNVTENLRPNGYNVIKNNLKINFVLFCKYVAKYVITHCFYNMTLSSRNLALVAGVSSIFFCSTPFSSHSDMTRSAACSTICTLYSTYDMTNL